MIIVKLIGGLGNQLFQYAAARRLAQARSVPLKLDISGFGEYKLHKYSLAHFNIAEDFADEACRPPKGLLRKAADLAGGYPGAGGFTRLFKEKSLRFDPALLEAPGNVYLDGYWQSEKYFKDAEALLRGELTFREGPDKANAPLAAEIAGCAAASLHVRRGDYAANPVTTGIHGLVGMDYYERAMRLLSAKVPGVRFFAFTDDPEWTAKNLSADYPVTLVGHNNADKNYEDLRLMSLCGHNIIANSTFSWWGAWLNAHPGKTVIAPAGWFKAGTHDSADLVPENWLRL